MKTWLSSTLERIYPRTPPRLQETLTLDAARGERVSFQVAVHNPDGDEARPTLSLACALPTRVRRVGFVPMRHRDTRLDHDDSEGAEFLPGWCPDPLFDAASMALGPGETQSFWCNVVVPIDVKPGEHRCVAAVTRDQTTIGEMAVTLRVHELRLQPRRNFPVVQWFYADALCDRYQVQPFDDGFWKLAETYMRNLTEHFQDCIYVPVFTPPLDGVKRPTQLLKVEQAGDRFHFEWGDVKRWVDTAKKCGISHFEWTHFFTQWGVKNAIRIYERSGGPNPTERHLLWPPETEATAPLYRNFLAQFMPEFKSFLEREGILASSFFHVSDEPGKDHHDDYRKARQLLREVAPWMRVMDALSDIEFGRMHLTDLPIPSVDHVPEFAREGIGFGTYYCGGQRGRLLNRLFETPLAKIRMNGWLFYRFQPKLFLHWGYNYWYQSQTRHLIDPYQIGDALSWPGWAHGDPMCVYPGPDGPVDSLRWEVFAESMQDYALLQTAGVDPKGELLADCLDFARFPRDAGWIYAARRTILR